MCCTCCRHQAHREGEGRGGGKLPRDPRRLGAPLSLRNIAYTIMRHFKQKNFSPEELRPRECFPGPRMSLSLTNNGETLPTSLGFDCRHNVTGWVDHSYISLNLIKIKSYPNFCVKRISSLGPILYK